MWVSCMSEKRTCDNCEYAKPGVLWSERWCTNPQSTYCDYYVDKDSHCKAWEGKEDESV